MEGETCGGAVSSESHEVKNLTLVRLVTVPWLSRVPENDGPQLNEIKPNTSLTALLSL